ncbi:protein kinase domain-containing protein [Nocardia macrotermitis]|uniref:Serine/threonine-protein kinase PknD n=1 Tax=Nocardia macrotermitis TaxID=2585198 RepID=A0A7K0D6T9_9NOCA|nr:protein kinase [Nocardia macrotermitis]MQY21463.1 Serine/threonine-protein kinase PknD [Nocardia macrotermitis]
MSSGSEMQEDDAFKTQRAVMPKIAEELRAAGFDDAEEIGHGGFGVVYRCTEISLDRTVAVKILTADLDADDRARFLREQRAMAQLTAHPNIVGVLQVGVTDSGLPYLVMPYHAHGSLESQLRLRGVLPVEAGLRLGVKIAGALETAHRAGILHRDVKPANILLTDYGEPALADFGIAQMTGGFRTTSGTIAGSPAYTAPEVLSGDPPTPVSDVYGLGATLFTALSGHAAYERHSGEQVVAQFIRITSQPVPDLREHGMPDDVAAAIEAAMSPDPRDRPTAAAFGERLRGSQALHGLAADDMALHTDPLAEPARRPHPFGSRPPGTAGRRGQAPVELTSFINRRSELSEMKNLLSTARLVTLTGIGGVGKTRLALRATSSLRREFVDGTWLVELGELRDATLLLNVVAAAIGLGDWNSQPLREVLLGFFGDRRCLLVLDNCEHVIAAVAELATTLLRVCPELRIIATSREPLDIRGEAVLRVPPLTTPAPDWEASLRGLPRYDAVSLFAERAAQTVAGFEITEANKADIAGICARLDGLPLAIELAAARLRAMSPDQILERLTDRYALLTRSSRDAPVRQQTLRWSIDWSYELCTEAEQVLWQRLSVFAGGFELDAAEWICGRDPLAQDTVDTLGALVDKSIVIREETDGLVRFRLLETLREYGADKLRDSGEYPRLRRAHRDWFARMASDAEAGWLGDRQLEWIERIEREQSNLREALEYCLTDRDEDAADIGLRTVNALILYWQARGRYDECGRWIDRMLHHPGRQSPPERVEALFSAGSMAALQGDLDSAAALTAQARTIADRTDDSMTRALADTAEALCALLRGEFTQAFSTLEAAVEAFESLGRTRLQVSAAIVLGLACQTGGDPERATANLRRAIALTEARGETVQRSYALLVLGEVAWQQGDPDRSRQALEQALRLESRTHSPVTASTGMEFLAWIEAAQDHIERAAVLLGAAAEVGRSAGISWINTPELVSFHDRCVRAARRELGDREFDRAVRAGHAMTRDAAIAFALGEQPTPADPPATTAPTLTRREEQVAHLVAEGMTNKQIATKLVISQRTAQGHVEHILTKLGYTSRAQIAAWIAGRHDQD